MEIRYQYFEEEKLLIQKFIGLFSLESYKNNSSRIHQNLKMKEIKKVLIDFRDLKINKNKDDFLDDFDDRIEEIVDYRKEINKNELANKAIVLVMWVDKPFPTTIVHLFQENFSKMKYNYCSTEEKVIEILNIKPNFNLSSKVNNLSNSASDL